jgi:type II secretory pathway pseudopilin PulG
MNRLHTLLRERRTDRGDGGYTLIEIMVAMSLTALVLVLIFPVIATIGSVSSDTNSSANGTAQARQVLQQLSSDVGSANGNNVCFPTAVLSAPPTSACVSAGSTGYPLVILSNAYGTCKWYQWTVNSANQLTQQSAVKGATTWSAVAPLVGPVVNTTSQSLFSYDATNSVLNVQLVVQGSTGTSVAGSSTAKANTQDVDLQTSITLYTTSASPPAGSC